MPLRTIAQHLSLSRFCMPATTALATGQESAAQPGIPLSDPQEATQQRTAAPTLPALLPANAGGSPWLSGLGSFVTGAAVRQC